jgi:hypothetical protein
MKITKKINIKTPSFSLRAAEERTSWFYQFLGKLNNWKIKGLKGHKKDYCWDLKTR